ncbi:MAG TPA: transposase [Terriglobales bacterium]|nr:transposase [Terriglobales bacterium]
MGSPLDRNYAYRRRLPHCQKHGTPVFITFRKALPGSFSRPMRDVILNHCLHDHRKKYVLNAVVVMPDHVHLLLTPLPDKDGWPLSLPAILKSLKGTSARSVNKLAGSTGPVWQDESFDHVLRSDDSLTQKIEYIRQNPVRRGLVSSPEDYPWLWIDPVCTSL